jgi:hypothetical protein
VGGYQLAACVQFGCDCLPVGRSALLLDYGGSVGGAIYGGMTGGNQYGLEGIFSGFQFGYLGSNIGESINGICEVVRCENFGVDHLV